MKDSQILSTFQERPTPASPKRGLGSVSGPWAFDACQLGVVLRAVLFVQGVLAAAVMFGVDTPMAWLAQWSLLTVGSLPATLAWLVLACVLKRLLARLPLGWQQAAGIGLGALAGLYGCAMLTLAGVLAPGPWLASAVSGGLLSAALVSALVLRAKGTVPAAQAARLAELQARIRPHFLFNTLNSAIALVRAEPAKAEGLLEDLSDLFHHALDESGESVSLADELDMAQRYLAIEQLRFGDRLRLEWRIDHDADMARLPPLLLQPLVENAVKHGVEPSVDGALVKVSTQRRGSTVVIKVTNTVNPTQSVVTGGNGLALRNVRERLGLLHDVQGRFQCGLSDGVFQVRIEVPC